MSSKIIQTLQMRVEGHLDAPETTAKRKEIILSKTFLHNFYKDCYSFFRKTSENATTGLRLEIGSGAGFLKRQISGVVRSDIQYLPELDLVCSAQNLPFAGNSLSTVYMLNVLHHIQDSHLFFDEVLRCLKPGGVLVMIEPASTLWANFVYRNFHNEPFDKKQTDWGLSLGGPLSTANGALPWIIFRRDRDLFTNRFPELEIKKIDYFSPIIYLLSGGFSYKQLLPGFCYTMIEIIERLLYPFNGVLGLFMRVKIRCAK
jgi:SAM-dependent methyltransferase